VGVVDRPDVPGKLTAAPEEVGPLGRGRNQWLHENEDRPGRFLDLPSWISLGELVLYR
jgi:hypothetical protein